MNTSPVDALRHNGVVYENPEGWGLRDARARQLTADTTLLEFGWRAEACAAGGDFLDGGDDFFVCVAEDHRTPRADIVDELATVRRPHPWAECTFKKNRVAANAAKGTHG